MEPITKPKQIVELEIPECEGKLTYSLDLTNSKDALEADTLSELFHEKTKALLLGLAILQQPDKPQFFQPYAVGQLFRYLNSSQDKTPPDPQKQIPILDVHIFAIRKLDNNNFASKYICKRSQMQNSDLLKKQFNCLEKAISGDDQHKQLLLQIGKESKIDLDPNEAYQSALMSMSNPFLLKIQPELPFQLMVHAAKGGHIQAMFQVAGFYSTGHYTQKNDEKAREWLEKAGVTLAKEEIAPEEGSSKGPIKEEEEEEEIVFSGGIIQRLHEQAKAGVAESQYSLGYKLKNGMRVEKNYPLAIKWYEAASKQGHPKAMNNLGLMHELGLGTEKNDKEAFRYYTIAKDSSAIAKANFYRLLASGKVGTSPNIQQVVSEFERVCTENIIDTYIKLGLIADLKTLHSLAHTHQNNQLYTLLEPKIRKYERNRLQQG